MQLMTFNVLRDALHEDGDRREQVAQLVAEHAPDVLCMQEGGDDAFWTQWAQAQGYAAFVNVPGEFAPALFAKARPLRAEVLRMGKGVVYTQYPCGSDTIGVYCLHLHHVPGDDEIRCEELHTLMDRVAARGDRYVCLAGDFNSRSAGELGEPWLLNMLAEDRSRTGAGEWIAATGLMREHGFVDSYRHCMAAPGYSWHPSQERLARCTDARMIPRCSALGQNGDSQTFVPAGVRLDYVFANPALAEHLTSCDVINSDAAHIASDHLPVVACFDLPPSE